MGSPMPNGEYEPDGAWKRALMLKAAVHGNE